MKDLFTRYANDIKKADQVTFEYDEDPQQSAIKEEDNDSDSEQDEQNKQKRVSSLLLPVQTSLSPRSSDAKPLNSSFDAVNERSLSQNKINKPAKPIKRESKFKNILAQNLQQ